MKWFDEMLQEIGESIRDLYNAPGENDIKRQRIKRYMDDNGLSIEFAWFMANMQEE